ncbi:MAG TPA: hypothetical protein VHL98_06310 [Microvirga sp.]|jgi:hypothetical protein|nr:hypothetical protein [Microvirga sp.]
MGLIRRRTAVLLSATVLAGAALVVEPAAVRDLRFGDGARQVTIGAVRTSLWSAALAQADTMVLENVTVTLGPVTYTAPRIEFTGVTSTRAEIEALVDKTSSEPLAARLARVSARQVSIPEIRSEQAGALRAASVQKNTILSGVSQGRVAEVTIEGGAGESETPEGKIRYIQGRMTTTDLDVAGIARVVLERAATNAEPMRKLGGTFSMDGMQFSGPDGVEVKIGRAAGRDFYARPTADSWAGLFSLIPAMAEAGKPSEQDSARLVASMADFMGAFDYGAMEISGISVTPPAKAGANASGRVARIAYTGSVGGLTPDARLEGLEITSPEGTARIGTIAFTGFSFQSTAEGLKALKGKRMEDLDPESLRRLMPTIGTIRFSGLDFDLPNEAKAGAKGTKPERVRFTLKDLEFTADKPLNGVPTNLRVGLQNFAMPIDPNTQEEGLKDLASLGYKQLDLSFTTAANWNEAGNELVIREVSTRIPEMGAISLKGVIGNVTKDVFNADSAIATVALVGATAKNLDLTVENGGLFERFLTRESKKQSKTPEALRRELGTAAAVMVPALLGNSAQAKTLGQAVARFVAKPGRLSISAKTKSSAGLGFTDVMMLGEPVEILDKLDISAKAE